jgi:hypothetical protein
VASSSTPENPELQNNWSLLSYHHRTFYITSSANHIKQKVGVLPQISRHSTLYIHQATKLDAERRTMTGKPGEIWRNLACPSAVARSSLRGLYCQVLSSLAGRICGESLLNHSQRVCYCTVSRMWMITIVQREQQGHLSPVVVLFISRLIPRVSMFILQGLAQIILRNNASPFDAPLKPCQDGCSYPYLIRSGSFSRVSIVD